MHVQQELKRIYDVIVIGAGPGGLTAATLLSAAATLDVLVIEKGREFEERRCVCTHPGFCSNQGCEILSGVGGTACVYGSKLCGYPSGGAFHEIVGDQPIQISHSYLTSILTGASPNLLAAMNASCPIDLRLQPVPGGVWKPYNASILSRSEIAEFVMTLVAKVRQAGTTILSKTSVKNIEVFPEGFRLLCLTSGGQAFDVIAKQVIIATGRSGASWLRKTLVPLGIQPESSYFDVGIRLEAPLAALQSFATDYGEDAKLKFRTSPYEVRTFCVCVGGTLARVTYQGVDYAEGVFGEHLSEYGNLALMCRVPLAAENECDRTAMLTAANMTSGAGIMTQDLVSFLQGSTPVMRRHPTIAARLGSLRESIPPAIMTSLLEGLTQLLKVAPALIANETMVIAPAVDHYWNIFRTDSTFMTHVNGLYLIGDAVGRFRGMLQAAWSGAICARDILASVDDFAHANTGAVLGKRELKSRVVSMST